MKQVILIGLVAVTILFSGCVQSQGYDSTDTINTLNLQTDTLNLQNQIDKLEKKVSWLELIMYMDACRENCYNEEDFLLDNPEWMKCMTCCAHEQTRIQAETAKGNYDDWVFNTTFIPPYEC